jgi:hypothetical protein
MEMITRRRLPPVKLYSQVKIVAAKRSGKTNRGKPRNPLVTQVSR